MKSKTLIERHFWSSFSQINPYNFKQLEVYWFANALHMAFRYSQPGYFKNARVCYGNKTIELHVDKHGNLVFRHYEVSSQRP